MDKDFLEINLHTVDDKVKISSAARDNPEIILDYFPPFGEGAGYTPLELLLISFSACISTVLLTLFRLKMHKTINAIKVNAKGVLKKEHPKAFSDIRLEIIIISPDLEEPEADKALAVSEEKLCPVWAMLKGNVGINISYTIVK